MAKAGRNVSGLVFMTALALFLVTAGICFAEGPAKQKPDRIIASDYKTLQDAVDAAKELGVYHIYIPSGVYYLDKTLNLTGLNWAPLYDETPGGKVTVPHFRTMTFEGAGSTTIIVANTGDTPAIDLTACQPHMIMRNFVLQTPYNTEDPKDPHFEKGSSVGILAARSKKGASSGGHHFENIRFSGMFSTACMLSWDSEGNSYIHCRFYNIAGDAFIFTNFNREGVKSPYMENGDSSNVLAYFYGTSFGTEGDGAVGLRITGASDVYLHGGFFHTGGKAFAAVYLDGTSHVRNFVMRDVRMELLGGHGLYAVGAVKDVLIQGGEWCVMNAECIRHEEHIPSKAGPHRFVAFPESSGKAQNWVAQNVSFSRSFEEDPNLALDKASIKGLPSVRFESLQDSRFVNNSFYVRRKKAGDDWKAGPDNETPNIVVEKYSRRNFFEAASREAVDLRGDAKSNTIVALCDGAEDKVPALWMGGYSDSRSWGQKYYDEGTLRTYIKPDEGQSLLNLGMTDVNKFVNPHKGDFVLHDGTGFDDSEPRLAIYNGKKWVFFDTVPSAEEPKK